MYQCASWTASTTQAQSNVATCPLDKVSRMLASTRTTKTMRTLLRLALTEKRAIREARTTSKELTVSIIKTPTPRTMRLTTWARKTCSIKECHLFILLTMVLPRKTWSPARRTSRQLGFHRVRQANNETKCTKQKVTFQIQVWRPSTSCTSSSLSSKAKERTVAAVSSSIRTWTPDMKTNSVKWDKRRYHSQLLPRSKSTRRTSSEKDLVNFTTPMALQRRRDKSSPRWDIGTMCMETPLCRLRSPLTTHVTKRQMPTNRRRTTKSTSSSRSHWDQAITTLH